MKEFAKAVAASSQGAGEQVTSRYLAGSGGWNERQGNVLEGIPLVVIGGNYFTQPGNPQVWPNDGLVALDSALATDVSAQVVAEATRHVFPDVHSIYFTHLLGLPMERGLTWDPDVLGVVMKAIG